VAELTCQGPCLPCRSWQPFKYLSNLLWADHKGNGDEKHTPGREGTALQDYLSFARPLGLYGRSWQNCHSDPQMLNAALGVTPDPASGFGLRVQVWMRRLVRAGSDSSVEECF